MIYLYTHVFLYVTITLKSIFVYGMFHKYGILKIYVLQ